MQAINTDLSSLIGKEVRRVTFTLKRGDSYILVFSVIEEVLPFMQDYDDYKADGGFFIQRARGSVGKSKDKIYFTIDFFTVTKDFLDNPAKNFILSNQEKTRIACIGKYSPSPLAPDRVWITDSHKSSDLLKCLPRREGSIYLKAWTDSSFSIGAEITASDKFMSMYSQVSTDHYGVDLSEYPDFIGNIYLLRYNPYYRKIHWSVSDNPPGIYASVIPSGYTGHITAEITNKSQSGLFGYETTADLDLSRLNHFIPLPYIPDSLDIHIKDNAGNLIEASDGITFIRKIGVGMQVASSTISITHRDGHKDSAVKYCSEDFSVGEGEQQTDVLLQSNEQVFKMLENSLEFAFFNGSKIEAERQANKARAAAFIGRVLSRASRKCMIADPYFNLDDLSRYVYRMPQLDIAVRVLGSAEFLSDKTDDKKNKKNREKEARAITASISAMKKKYPGMDIQFRLLTGKSPLHDRYIVADDDVWLLGSSLNEIGRRACTIIKLPKASARTIIAQLDSWWSDDVLTQPVENYGK